MFWSGKAFKVRNLKPTRNEQLVQRNWQKCMEAKHVMFIHFSYLQTWWLKPDSQSSFLPALWLAVYSPHSSTLTRLLNSIPKRVLAPFWLDELVSYAPPSTVIMLVGNKCDLASHRMVSSRDPRPWHMPSRRNQHPPFCSQLLKIHIQHEEKPHHLIGGDKGKNQNSVETKMANKNGLGSSVITSVISNPANIPCLATHHMF